MSYLNRIRESVNRSVDWITISLLVILIVIVALQVFFRYVLSSSLGWSEELARFLFIWVVFLGAEMTLRNKAHIAFDSLFQKLQGLGRLLLSLLINGIIIVFAIILFVSGMELFQSVDRPSSALRIPMNYVYVIVPISMGLMIINTLFDVIGNLTSYQQDTSKE